jgi:hypothetical protein
MSPGDRKPERPVTASLCAVSQVRAFEENRKNETRHNDCNNHQEHHRKWGALSGKKDVERLTQQDETKKSKDAAEDRRKKVRHKYLTNFQPQLSHQDSFNRNDRGQREKGYERVRKEDWNR